MTAARAALKDGRYQDAIALAVSSLDYIDGMMQYEKKYDGKEFDSIDSIDLLHRYAPYLFEFEVLDSIEALLKGQRRIEKNTSRDLGDRLDESRTRMWEAHRLWSHLEQQPEARQDILSRVLGG